MSNSSPTRQTAEPAAIGHSTESGFISSSLHLLGPERSPMEKRLIDVLETPTEAQKNLHRTRV